MKIRFGAGTIITFALVLVFAGYSIIKQRNQQRQPAIVESTVIGNTSKGIFPAPEFLLRHKKDLSLSVEQTTQIEKIAKAYRKDIAPYQQQMKKATAEYDHKITSSPQETPRTASELQQAGSEVQHLSAIVATTRHAYWQQACRVLTAQQVSQLMVLMKNIRLQDLQ